MRAAARRRPPRVPLAVGDNVSEPSTAAQRTALVELTWPAQPQFIPNLRAEVRDCLSRLGYSGETVEDIVLAVNEAASNVVTTPTLRRVRGTPSTR